jgi:hypothetical protein
MHKVFVEFTRPKDKMFPVFSWAIRLFEKTKYSHVRLRWDSVTGEQLIYEASGSSVKLIGRYANAKHPVDVVHSYEFSLTREQYRKMIGLFRYAGADYGVWQILGIAIAKLCGLKKNPFASGKYSQVCSELVGYFFTEALGMNIGQDLDTATPRDLKEYCDKLKA